MKLLQCLECGKTKPSTEFYVKRSYSTGVMGYQSRCKLCHNMVTSVARARREAKREAEIEAELLKYKLPGGIKP